MDIMDGTAHEAAQPLVQPQRRSRPDVVKSDKTEASFLLNTIAGESVDGCFDGLLDFLRTHVVNMNVEGFFESRGMSSVHARGWDTQRAAAFILADPRCVLRNGMPMPADKKIFDSFFDETLVPKTEGAVQAAYTRHCRLARMLFTGAKPVLERTTHAQAGEGNKDLAEEQQEEIQELVTRSLEDKNLAQIYGDLAPHPSILFVYGWLCYKSGTGEHLLRAISMLTDAGKRGLLRATCGLLRALARFYIICETEEAIAREYVTADLLEALSVAARSQEHDAVETPLLVEANSALAVLFISSWADPRDEFRTVMREIQKLRARKHCIDAHRLYQMWRGVKLPSRLFLRASRLCEIDPPTGFSWKQTEHVLSRMTMKWRHKHGAVPEHVARNMGRIHAGRGTGRSQVTGYESFAGLLPPPAPAVVAKVVEEAAKWNKTKHSLELRKQPPKRLCQLCGAVPAQLPCNRCKSVIYCSNNCMHFDRISAAHNTICIGKEIDL